MFTWTLTLVASVWGCGSDVECPPGTSKDGLRCVTVDAGADAAICDEGMADCDDEPGCETSLRDTVEHCGGCGYRCTTGERCAEGICTDEQAVSVGAGSGAACAALASGSVHCWGDNSDGQLGNGSTEPSDEPVQVSGVDAAVDVSMSARHVCARSAAGRVWCWGANDRGQVGTGGTANVTNATVVALPNPAVRVVAGGQSSCAALDDGAVYCWGTLDDGRHETPVLIDGIRANTDLAVGGQHFCAVDSGTLTCWGQNSMGQLGDGTTTPSPTGVTVDLDDVTRVAAGALFTCAVQRAGVVQCWGANNEGQLGDGTTETRPEPAPATGVSNAVNLSSGSSRTCVVTTDAELLCWGGMPRSTDTSVPRRNTDVPNAKDVSISIVGCVIAPDGRVFCWDPATPVHEVPIRPGSAG